MHDSEVVTDELNSTSGEQQVARARRLRWQFKVTSVIVPVLFGLVFHRLLDDMGELATLAFLAGVPTIITLLGLMYSDPEELQLYRARIVQPIVITVLLILGLFVFGDESAVCLFFIAGPFVVIGCIVAFLNGLSALRRRRRNALHLALLLPVAFIAWDYFIGRPLETRHVAQSIVIACDARTVWNNVTTVRPIAEDEISRGFWQLVGIPAPIEATLDRDGVGATRIGRFERGLRFVERVIAWEPARYVEFTVNVDTTSLDDPMIDRHVLTGSYFAFGTVSYRIDSLDDRHVRLTLACTYRLRSSINRYSALWGDAVIGDFESRLLNVIANRCEAHTLEDQAQRRSATVWPTTNEGQQ